MSSMIGTPAPTIVCVDCGGECSLLNARDVDPEAPEDPVWEPGDIASYRCHDCLDRWDIVLTDDDFDTAPDIPDA